MQTYRASALLLAAVALFSFPGAARAEESLRGDLPPSARNQAALLEQAKQIGDLPSMVEHLHDLLLERLGDTGLQSEVLYLAALDGMLDAVNQHIDEEGASRRENLPPAGMLLPSEEAQRLKANLRGRLTGIGMEFQHRPDQGLLRITRVVSKAPADEAGLVVGDRILGTAQESFRGQSLAQILADLQGAAGTQLVLDVVREHGSGYHRLAVAVDRREFALPTVRSSLAANGVGVVGISQFHRDTPGEVEEAIEHLRTRGARRLVLDLRNSSGGDLDAVALVADLFLPPSSVVVRLVESGVGEEDLLAPGEVRVHEELAILVNRWTYGAAEALAAALQEHSRGYVIGERTLGEGRVETLIPLSEGLVLRLDSVQLLSPTGRSWHGEGLRPDQVFLGAWAGLERGEMSARDPVFDTAVHYLETADRQR